MNLKENDVVLCTVKRIEKTTVFLDIEDDGQGTMIFSEVSPGRIRNIRDYITINKKIVCKVLEIKQNHPILSLRRVTAKEREAVLEFYKKQKMLTNMLKPLFKEKTIEYLNKIKEKYELPEFLDEARENPSLLEKFFPKASLPQLQKIFSEKKEKEKEVQTIVILKSQSPSGLKDIQSALNIPNTEIHYKGSSKFSIAVKAKDFKTANHNLEQAITQLKEKAKSLNLSLEIKETKK